MNEEFQKKSLEYLESLEAGIGSATEFAADQAPLVVQEYIRWQITVGVMESLVGLSLIAATCLIVTRLILPFLKREKCPPEATFLVFVVAAIFCVLPSIFVFSGSQAALKAWVAPRVVILEKISELASH